MTARIGDNFDRMSKLREYANDICSDQAKKVAAKEKCVTMKRSEI